MKLEGFIEWYLCVFDFPIIFGRIILELGSIELINTASFEIPLPSVLLLSVISLLTKAQTNIVGCFGIKSFTL